MTYYVWVSMMLWWWESNVLETSRDRVGDVGMKNLWEKMETWKSLVLIILIILILQYLQCLKRLRLLEICNMVVACCNHVSLDHLVSSGGHGKSHASKQPSARLILSSWVVEPFALSLGYTGRSVKKHWNPVDLTNQCMIVNVIIYNMINILVCGSMQGVCCMMHVLLRKNLQPDCNPICTVIV